MVTSQFDLAPILTNGAHLARTVGHWKMVKSCLCTKEMNIGNHGLLTGVNKVLQGEEKMLALLLVSQLK